MFLIYLITFSFLPTESAPTKKFQDFKLNPDGSPDLQSIQNMPKNIKTKSDEPLHTIDIYAQSEDSQSNDLFLSLTKNEKLSKIKIQLIDCTENKFYCEDQGITSFPQVIFSTKNQPQNYNWGINERDVTEFALKVFGSDIKEITTLDELSEFSKHPVSFILYYNPEISGVIQKNYIEDYKKIAKEYKKSRVYLAMCKTEEVSYMHGIDRSNLPVLVQLGDDEAYSYKLSGKLNENNMRRFIETHKCVMKIVVTDNNWNDAIECFKGKVVGISVYDQNPSGLLSIGHLNFLIRDLRNNDDWRFQMASVNFTNFPELAKGFGVSKGNTFVIADYRGEPVFLEVTNANLKDKEKIKHMLEKVWNGEDLVGLGINIEKSEIDPPSIHKKGVKAPEKVPIKNDL